MLNRLPILLAQTQAGNNSIKLKNETRQILYSLFYKMETFFMNSKNSKTNEPNRFKYDLIDKLDLKNPNKNMVLGNLSIYYSCKNVKSTYNTNTFKYQHQLGMKHLTCLMDRIIYQKCKIILNI